MAKPRIEHIVEPLIEIGLVIVPTRPTTDKRGITRICQSELLPVNMTTMRKIDSVKGLCWGSIDRQLIDSGLLTDEHVSTKKKYLLLVVECENAIDIRND